MACYHPVLVSVLMKPKFDGAERSREGRMVPCGHCLGCRADQARDWSIRIQHEAQVHDFSWFVTLTYREEDLPEHGSLRAKDLRKFFKALRRELSQKKKPEAISYFACGEYGEVSQRPHYHAVLFGPSFLDRRPWRDSGSGVVWRSPTLERHWTFGNVEFGTVTPASAQYVAGYVRKKVHRSDNPDHYLRVDEDTGELVELQEEFARMSRRPAIGKRWIQKNWREVYPRDKVVVDGLEFSPPRYYDKWMEEHHPEIMSLVRNRRLEKQEEVPEQKLAAMEKIHGARVDLFQQRSKV